MSILRNPSAHFPAVLHGGDYNPDQWPEAVWDDDVRLMREANVNVATLPVFSWVALQPDEDTFALDWLDRILHKLWDGGIYTCLATSTAAQPAWLSQKYPDVLPVGRDGVRRKHGNRQNFCPNSENFRRLSSGLARRLAERYKDFPGLLLWHISNEYGNHCYCDVCAAAFRVWLQTRDGSLAEVNRRWNPSRRRSANFRARIPAACSATASTLKPPKFWQPTARIFTRASLPSPSMRLAMDALVISPRSWKTMPCAC